MEKTTNFSKCKLGRVKSRFIFTLLAILLLFSFRAEAQSTDKVAYALLSSDGKRLTFKYVPKSEYAELVRSKDVVERVTDRFYYPLYIVGRNSSKPDPLSLSISSQSKYVNEYQNMTITSEISAYSKVTTVVFDDSFKDFEPTNLNKWFACLPRKLTTVTNFDKNVKFDYVTSIYSMFNYFGGPEYGFDTDNEDYPGLENESIIYTILSQIPMDNVINMSYLFQNSYLTKFDISKIPNYQTSFNTSNVTDMSIMFSGCRYLKSVNLAQMKTNSVTNMGNMFSGCDELESVDLSGINTPNVESMWAMFDQCKNLTTITGLEDEGFNTSKVTDMNRMFYDCEKLELPESATKALEVGSVTRMSSMFANCKSIRKIDLSNTDADGTHLEYMAQCFKGCTNLESINLKGITFSSIDDGKSNRIFEDCSSLKEIDLSGFSAVSGYMLFTNCSSLKKILFPEGGLQLSTNLWAMFQGCSSLDYIDFSKFKVSGDDIWIAYFCNNCSNLINVDLTFLNGKTISSVQNAFEGCEKLASILVSDPFTMSTTYDDDDVYDVNAISIGKRKDMPVFDGCTEIIGDKGSRYDASHIKKDYAIIDGGESSPGYLTTGKYKIFYELDGGTLPDGKINPTEFAESDEVTLINPEKQYYTFTGWTGTRASNLTEKTLNVSFKNSQGNRIYTANWELNKYTITFDTDGGTEIAAITQDYDSPIKAPDDPDKLGYNFAKWDKVIPATMPATDMTITALWNAINYNITLDYDGGKLPDGKTNPTTYTIEDVFTFEEPIRTDYVFNGWYSVNDKKVIAAIEHSTGDISLVAQWLPRITAEVEGTFNFPSDQNKFCDGSEKSVSVTYTIIRGDATDYTLTFEGNAIPEIKGKADGNPIVINIPEDLWSGVYKGSLVFTDANNVYGESIDYPITITANIPRPAAVQLYTDMLLADNHEGNFASYQWYKDGNAISGATLGHYYEATLSGKYTVKITTTDGKEFMSCPVKLVTAKAQKQSVKVYPNPAKKGEVITIEIENYTDGGDYTIKIFSSNGSLVKQLTAVSKTTQIALPSGIYSGSLINGGEKSGFKLIVK